MLNNTAALLDETTVFKAAEMIKNAKNINLYALAQHHIRRQEFRYNWSLQVSVQRVHRSLKHQSQVTNTSPGDLSIFIARSIMMKDIYQAPAPPSTGAERT